MLKIHAGTILKTKGLTNYAYVHIYIYVQTRTQTYHFCITAYKFSTALLDVGIFLRYTPHLCAKITVEISKEITASNRQLTA